MKIAISYFYQIRFFLKNMVPFSTAVWDSKWYMTIMDRSIYFLTKGGGCKWFTCSNACEKIRQRVGFEEEAVAVLIVHESSDNPCSCGKRCVAYQLLPWNMRAWHCGSGSNGSGNNNLISLEMTEPATIKYVGGSNWIELGDGPNTKSHVLATYANAVQFFACISKKFGFNPEVRLGRLRTRIMRSIYAKIIGVIEYMMIQERKFIP